MFGRRNQTGLPNWQTIRTQLDRLGPGVTAASWTVVVYSSTWLPPTRDELTPVTLPTLTDSRPSLGQDDREAAVMATITSTLALMSEAITEELSRTPKAWGSISFGSRRAARPRRSVLVPLLLSLVALGSLAAGVASLLASR